MYLKKFNHRVDSNTTYSMVQFNAFYFGSSMVAFRNTTQLVLITMIEIDRGRNGELGFVSNFKIV